MYELKLIGMTNSEYSLSIDNLIDTEFKMLMTFNSKENLIFILNYCETVTKNFLIGELYSVDNIYVKMICHKDDRLVSRGGKMITTIKFLVEVGSVFYVFQLKEI